MAWKPIVKVDGTWSRNGLVFATKEEAEASARDLMNRWFAVTDSSAEETIATPNYTYSDGKLDPIIASVPSA